MSQEKEIRVISKISEELQNAFKKVHELCGVYLEGANQHKKQSKEQSSKKQNEEKKNGNDQSKKQSSKKHQQTETKEKSKSERSKHKKPFNPDRPKGVLSAFFYFAQENRESIKHQYPQLSQTELVTVIGQVWSQLSAQEKKPYEQKAVKDKVRHKQQMEVFLKKYPDERSKKQKKSDKKEEKQSKKASDYRFKIKQ